MLVKHTAQSVFNGLLMRLNTGERVNPKKEQGVKLALFLILELTGSISKRG